MGQRVGVRLRLFASAREAAGVGEACFGGEDVEQVLGAAIGQFGPAFARVVEVSRVWVNGAPAEPSTRLNEGDELAVLPPVSGGM
ncbi:MAG: MoaD/ThiS family protein [Actinomycetota bacterium]|nr:MoaD/ThiS family protein [Actinomycetota bacterium]